MIRRTLALGALAASLGIAVAVHAQRIDPKRPTTLIVGAPGGASPAARVDARRTGFSRVPLPTGMLRIAWQKSLSTNIEGPPLVNDAGDVILVTGRGEIVTLEAWDGSEMPHGVVASAGPHGPAGLLTDSTVVFVTSAGDAVGARNGALRFRTRVGDGRMTNERAGVLALHDGGVALAAGTELATLDSEGHVRARATLEEPVAAPLVAVPQGKIAAITSTGKVFLWAPGREPIRTGNFGSPIDGAATLVDDHTLVAIAGLGQLVELDLSRGVAIARMSSPAILLGPPAFRGETAYLLATLPGRTFALAIDAAGQEIARVSLVTTPPPPVADGGPSPPTIPPHTGPLVDAAGTLAFASPEGHVGVVTKDGAVDVLGETFCLRAPGLSSARTPSPASPSAAYAGLAPAGPHAFVVACETGTVTKVIATKITTPLPGGGSGARSMSGL